MKMNAKKNSGNRRRLGLRMKFRSLFRTDNRTLNILELHLNERVVCMCFAFLLGSEIIREIEYQ